MTRAQVCKHRVCDYCGERFDMVTQRWWGNKFCKWACKNGYLRENGAARLAATLAVAVFMLLLLASANAAPSEEESPAGISLEFNKDDATLYIDLSGPILAGTADNVRAALAKYRTTLNRVVLFLDSAGGRVDDGDRLIEALNEIKLRHRLITVVAHGKLCASMCIPIFLQGEDRLAARASVWLFHEAAQRRANGELRTDRTETWRLFRKYYTPAGVPTRWLKSIAPMIEEADLWQSGGDLISAKSGIILHPLADRTVRDLTAPQVAPDSGDLPLDKKTAADEVGNAPIRSD